MRRIVAVIAGLVMTVGVMGVVPAQATHCTDAGTLAACETPVTVIAIEGIGYVCSAAVGKMTNPAYDHNCTTSTKDPLWNQVKGTLPRPPGNGLSWPALGPGMYSPYFLGIQGAANPPNNTCVSSLGGPGCKSISEGLLGDGANAGAGVGAHCGSSSGTGTINFQSAPDPVSGKVTSTSGISNWAQSAATILPLQGYIDTVNGKAIPVGKRQTLIGFTSSRGFNGGGNCGITQTTTQFQVEGMVVTF